MSSSKDNQPLYYGSSKGPSYYGGSGYGNAGYYGGGSDGADSGDSIIGAITIGRMIRVVCQRWITVVVFIVIGLVVSFAVYRISPTIYEAKSEFTMEMKRPQAQSLMGQLAEPDFGSTYEEIFNTRISDWRGAKIVSQILAQFRANYPASTVTDEQIINTLDKSVIELIRRSRLITISVRAQDKNFAANLANVYAKAIETFAADENKLRCDKAVAQLHADVEKEKRNGDRIAKDLLEFRTANKVDILRSSRETLRQGLTRTTSDILELESSITAAVEWEKILAKVQNDPENFGSLPTSVPRASEIATAYNVFQESLLTKNALLARYTTSHPAVRAKEKETEIYKQQFADVVARALATSRGTLQAMRNQLAQFRSKRDELNLDLANIEQKIVAAESGLEQLEREKDVSDSHYKLLIEQETMARTIADQNNESVRIGRLANVPDKPVLPDPVLIFAAGLVIGIVLGLLFVLILDHLEDTVVGLSDIEQRLSLKVLAVLPHVRRRKREQVAKFVSEDKFSQFSEAVAGLRSLLDSPRYQMLSHVVLCMSTQPGEGKTITSSSLAIANAQAGKRTLLVDFDLRRPRAVGVWGLKLDVNHSLSHVLSRNDSSVFPSLVMPSGIQHLDIIASLPPDGVTPSSIMGSQIVPEFFQWARENYERVIVDSPPYGIVGDVMTLASMVDSVMILCCPDRTRFKLIQHASRHLTEAGATIIGVVVNDVDMTGGSAFAPAGGRSYYGYGAYGYRSYGSKSGDNAKTGDAKQGDHSTDTKSASSPKTSDEFADDD